MEEIDASTAHERQSEGWIYVDVRSPQEFEAGHPKDALNIPIAFISAQGMSANPDFVTAIQKHLKTTDKLLMGCKSGGRSANAVHILSQHGYAHLVNVAGGFHGGGIPGWLARGLPTGGGKTWEALQ